jgi:hypothetical protein
MVDQSESQKDLLGSIVAKLAELERRVEALERRLGMARPVRTATRKVQGGVPIRHTYLAHAISEAKRQYERSG